MARLVHTFDRPERFVLGTVGQPGEQTFCLQARDGVRMVTVLLERAQARVLSERLVEMLEEVREQFGIDIPSSLPEASVDRDPLDTPVEESFRVGALAMAWSTEDETVIVEAHALSDDDEPIPPVLSDTGKGPDVLRVRMGAEQALAFSLRARRVLDAGSRPCPLCGELLDPAGHVCPRSNGYRRRAESVADR